MGWCLGLLTQSQTSWVLISCMTVWPLFMSIWHLRDLRREYNAESKVQTEHRLDERHMSFLHRHASFLKDRFEKTKERMFERNMADLKAREVVTMARIQSWL